MRSQVNYLRFHTISPAKGKPYIVATLETRIPFVEEHSTEHETIVPKSFDEVMRDEEFSTSLFSPEYFMLVE